MHSAASDIVPKKAQEVVYLSFTWVSVESIVGSKSVNKMFINRVRLTKNRRDFQVDPFFSVMRTLWNNYYYLVTILPDRFHNELDKKN